MSEFWDYLVNSRINQQPVNQAWQELSEEASFRPIIYIGLGGFGCSIIRKLKADVNALIPDPAVRDGFAFLGLDTHPRERNDILTEAEYVEMSVGVRPNEIARDVEKREALGWFNDLAGKWTSSAILAANATRAVGRFAFLFGATLSRYTLNLNQSLTRINQFRSGFAHNATPKAYVISTFAGGTGAGCFLDAFFITRKLFRERMGDDSVFQSISATPDALEGEASPTNYPNFYANTYSALKEMFHFIQGNSEVVPYYLRGEALENIKIDKGLLPDVSFVVTDSNSAGRAIVRELGELGEIVKSYLLAEIQTPIKTSDGNIKVHDRENPHDDMMGNRQMPRAFSSLGAVRFGLPYGPIEELFTLSILHKALREETAGAGGLVQAQLWISSNGLSEAGNDQLQEMIRKSRDGHELRVLLNIEDDLNLKEHTELPKDSATLKSAKENSISQSIKPLIDANAKSALERTKNALQQTFDEALAANSVGRAIDLLKGISAALQSHKDALTTELDSSRIKHKKAEQKVQQALQNVREAAGSGFWGRGGRIKSAVTSFGGDLEALLNQQIVVWSQEAGIALYDNLLSTGGEILARTKVLDDVLKSRLSYIDNRVKELILEIDSMSDINKRGAGNWFSIVDYPAVKKLYAGVIDASTETSLAEKARRAWRTNNELKDTVTKDADWIVSVAKTVTDEITNRLKSLNIISILDEFYPDGSKRDELFDSINKLGDPLFPVDGNLRENLYQKYRVIAVHPSLRESFSNIFERYKSAEEGISYAFCPSVYEIVLFTLGHGYTIHSLTKINNYKAHYDRLQSEYEYSFARQKSHRPIHAWAEASSWEEPVPEEPSDASARKIFAVGRAFNYLFPATDEQNEEKKRQTFIFDKGSNYYLMLEKGEKPQLVGKSLESALMNFEAHTDWQKVVNDQITHKIEELGRATIRRRLQEESLPLFKDAIEKAETGRDQDRTKLLRELAKAIGTFIEQDLREGL
ncbi:MAG: hypothetical protein M0024_05505 [Nitrospiraceae bacterium]|nr:hypothetical protein [Nitrospiraceae bacterium]